MLQQYHVKVLLCVSKFVSVSLLLHIHILRGTWCAPSCKRDATAACPCPLWHMVYSLLQAWRYCCMSMSCVAHDVLPPESVTLLLHVHVLCGAWRAPSWKRDATAACPFECNSVTLGRISFVSRTMCWEILSKNRHNGCCIKFYEENFSLKLNLNKNLLKLNI